MSFQSSILGMINTAAAGLKAKGFVKSAKADESKEPTATQVMHATAKEPAQVKEEPVFIGGQQVSPEIAAKVRAALEQKQKAEASMVVAQQQKRAKRAKAFAEEPMQDLEKFKHLGMEAIF